MSGAFGTNWLDLSSTANRYVQTYYRGFVDISGGPLYIRNNSLYLNSGDISLNGRLYGAGDVSFNSRLFVGQDTSLNGNLFVNSRTIQNGDISANSRLFVGSDVSMGGKLFTVGDTSHNARLFVGSDVSLNARLFVAGDISLNGNVNINGNLTVPTQTSTDNSTKVATTAFVKTALSSVTGASAGFTGDVSVNYRLYVGADASLQGRLYVNNDASLNQRLYVGSDVSFGNRLYVAGDVSMGGSLGLAGGNFYVNNSKTLIVNPSAFGSATGTSSSNTFTMFHTGQAMAVSYTGQYLLLSDPQGFGLGVVLSTNYGTTVSQITGQSFSSIVVYSVAMSSDGSKMAVATGSALYYSTNYGSTWTAGSTTSIGFLSATNDFSRLYGYGGGGVYLSTNNGSSFTLQSNTITYGVSGSGNSSNNCKFQMNSATGQYGIAYYNTSAYYTSNYGVTWTQATGLPTLRNNGGFVVMSSTGQYAFVDNTDGGNASSTSLFYSTNYGASFSQSTITGGTNASSHYGTTISSSGRYGICGNYVTTNYGANWSLSTAINSLFTSTGGFTLGAIISGNELYNFHTMYGTKYVYYQQNATTNLFSQSLLITSDISTNSRLFIANDVSMSSNLYVALTTILSGDVSANSRLFVGSDVSFGGKLFTVGDASLNGNVSIANDLTINGNMYVKAYTTKQMITELSYQLIIAEDISVNGRLFLSNDASINNRLFVGSDVSMGGKLFTVGDTSHNAKLFVGSDVSMGGKLFTVGDTSLNSRLFVGSDVSLNARLFVVGDLSLNGNVNINGNLTVPTQTSTDNSTKVATTAFVKTALSSVTGASAGFTGDVSVNYRLYVGSDASLSGRLFVAGDVSLNGNVSTITQTSTDNSTKVATTAFVKTALNSVGASSYFSTDVSMTGNLLVVKDLSLSGNFYSSTTNFSQLFLADNAVNVNQPATFTGYTANTIKADQTNFTSGIMNNSGIGYIFTYTGGSVGPVFNLFKTINGGATWTYVTNTNTLTYYNWNYRLDQSIKPILTDSTGQFVMFMPNGYTWISRNGGTTWSAMSLTSALTNNGFIATIPTNSTGLVYASDGSGLYKSTDFAVTWTKTTYAANPQTYGCIATSADGTYVFVSNNYNGLWASTNSGATGSVIYTFSTQVFYCVECSDDGKYLLLPGKAGNGLWVSSNYGVNFTYVALSVYTGNSFPYVSTTGQYMILYPYYSTNYGVTWSSVSTTITEPFWKISKNFIYSVNYVTNVGICYANDLLNYVNNIGYLNITPSRASSWKAASAINAIVEINGSTTSGGSLYTSGSAIIGGDASLNTRLFVSSDASFGGNLYVAQTANMNRITMASDLSMNGAQGSNIYLTGLINTTAEPFSLSTKITSSSGTPATANFTYCAMSNTGYGVACCNTGLYSTSDGGITWSLLNSTYTNVTTYPNGPPAIFIDVTGQYVLISFNATPAFYYSTNYGVTFQVCGGLSTASGGNNYCLTMAGASGAGFMMGAGLTGSYYTTNYGATWTASTTAPTINAYGTVCMAGNGSYMTKFTYGGTTALYRSTDGGNNWTSVSTTATGYFWFGAASLTGQYMVTVNNSNMIYVSSNYGATWTTITTPSAGYYQGSPFFISSTGQYQYVYGAYSTDYGATWTTSSSYINAMSNSGRFMLNTLGAVGIYYKINTFTPSIISSGDVSLNTNLSVGNNAYINNLMSAGSMSLTGPLSLVDNSVLLSANPPLDISSNSYFFAKNWTQIAGSVSSTWSTVAMSANGQYQTAAASGTASIYTSSNFGVNWTINTSAPTGAWYSVAMSSTGKYQAAVINNSYIYLSSNYGVTWSNSNTSTSPGTSGWQQIATSATGQYIGVVSSTGTWVSSNYGVTWTKTNSLSNLTCITMSATGQYQAVDGNSGQSVNISSNYGVTWKVAYGQATGYNNNLAMSATGQYIIMNQGNYGIGISSNYGASFTSVSSPASNNPGLAISATGQYMLFINYTGASAYNVYCSTNYGVTWTNTSAPTINWSCFAISANGQYVTGVVNGGYIYTANTPFANLSVSNSSLLMGDISANSRLFLGSDASFGGKLYVASTLTKGGGSFDIAHPDPSKPPGSRLRHCFVESPTRGDNIYRFKTTTTDLSASIVLPSYYKFLNEDTQIWVNAVNCLGSGYGVLQSDNETVRVTVSQDGDYNVLIIGTRKDQMMIDFFDNAGGVEYLIN